MDVEKRSYLRSKSAVERGQNRDSRPTKASPRKRTYQRDHNTRRNSWKARDQSSSSAKNEDLCSPCHKHPRFKGQQTSSQENRSPPNNKGPWNKNAESSKENSKKVAQLTNSEFPPLGFNDDRSTPESSKDWGSIIDEEKEASTQCNQQSQQIKAPKFKRRLLLSNSDSNESNKTEGEDKTNGKAEVLRPIITDPHKLTQRQKQIDIGKNTVSYGHYIKNVQRRERSKEDPWTPDKFQQCSTRSWVGQIKVWRRRLHTYDISSDTKEDLFSTSSAGSTPEPSKDWGSIMDEEEEASKQCNQQSEQKSQNSSQETEETSVNVEENSECTSIEDMFKEFDLDGCFVDDGFPL